MAQIVEGNELRDAALIASAQKLEHYEIAAYGTAAALAGQLNLRDDQKTLGTLDIRRTNREAAEFPGLQQRRCTAYPHRSH